MVGYAIDDPRQEGKGVADSKVDLVKPPIGVAQIGRVQARTSSPDALKRTLLW